MLSHPKTSVHGVPKSAGGLEHAPVIASHDESTHGSELEHVGPDGTQIVVIIVVV